MVEREELENAIRRLESQRESLGDAAVDAALDGLHQRLSELKSPEKVNRVAAVSTKSTGERRVMTVLFCDVVGSTALAEGMDPETWTQMSLLCPPAAHPYSAATGWSTSGEIHPRGHPSMADRTAAASAPTKIVWKTTATRANLAVCRRHEKSLISETGILARMIMLKGQIST